MYAKIQITGIIEVVTGMHIGASKAFSPIGAIDSPVVRDILSGLPMIPGSSLKGKMRTLLARQYNDEPASSPNHDDERIKRIFGATEPVVQGGRLLFSDMMMSNSKEVLDRGAEGLTEIKFENTINRLTSVANPRQIERVIRGAEFPLDLIYEITDKPEEIEEDFQIIHDGLRLLQYDYIGGSGSRGYGRIKFKDINAEKVVGNVDDGILEKCLDIMQDFK
ncbi:MAG: type III-A CRISPR-associated RAMP protein Csm3 [Firmicutes bacterium]|nr:type III-A CRISPR-associated RAMP protein Csm3 [Bacillota bacterium]